MTNEDIPELQSIWDDARGYIKHGNYNKAIEIYQYILIRYSDDPVAVEYANAYLGDVFLTTRRLDLAEKHLKNAITAAPAKGHYHYLLGFTYLVKEQWKNAVSAFLKVISLEHDNGEYERGLGWAMFNAGNRTEGIGHLYRALELTPDNVHAMTDLTTALLMLGNVEKAREYGEKALGIDPGYVLAQKLLKTIDQIERTRS